MHEALATSSNTLKLCFHITRRNWAVYRKDLIANISPSIADPAFVMLALGFGLGGYISQLDGRSYIAFLAPGLTVATSLFTSFFETSYGFYVRMTFENIYKAMLTTPIGPREIVLGEFFWVGLKGAFMATIVSLVLALFGLMAQPGLIFLMPVMGFLLGIAFGAIGLIASGAIHNINQIQTVYSFLISPLYFLSGIFYPLDALPKALLLAADLFPVTHGVRFAHAVFWNENVLAAVLTSSAALILQFLVYGGVAYTLIRKKLIAL